MNTPTGSYVVITAARNEAAFIELTLKSMVAQTVKPLKWVIVSDGSTDGTEEIVTKYAAQHGWIELLRMPDRKERHFAGKAHAFNAGCSRVSGLQYDIITNLDADISFGEDYFEFLLGKFGENPRLGVAGTPFSEVGETYDYRFVSTEHVSGACQLFRRQCFEAIGGYVPVKGGGIDLIAVLTARMKGWKTKTFLEKTCLHSRKQGSATHGALGGWFDTGRKDYVLGGHPLWEVFRWVYQMSKPPFIVGGCWLVAGYVWAMVRRAERSVSPELMKFRRVEQMQGLRRFLSRLVLFRRGSSKEPNSAAEPAGAANLSPQSNTRRASDPCRAASSGD
ncbi:MAG: glycosyl transferase [Verrucomicrobia bacterium]|nr:MAG: glycosyl transferase [Verrucomicrobiota bacterium]